MITNISKNCMGTVSFDGKFAGMRKAQDFIVYPMHKDSDAAKATVQSDTRIGTINLSTGEVAMSPSRSGGSYFVHMALTKPAGKLDAETLLLLKAAIFSTASEKAGSNSMHVYTDNSAAIKALSR